MLPLPKLVLPGAGSDTSEDDRLVESSDEMDGPVALRAVKWRPASRKEDRYVAPGNADLLRTIRRRDVNKVKMVLKDGSADLRDVSDEYGVTALEYAVRSGSTTIVDELLSVCTPDERSHAIERALLFAIKTNDIVIADHVIGLHISEGFCKRPGYEGVVTKAQESDDSDIYREDSIRLKMRQKRKWSMPRTLSTYSLIDETEFSQEMTPIVMAAQLERTEIMRMLIDRCCPDIHPLTRTPTCDHSQHNCYICKERVNFVGRQTIEECRKAIEVYKALSSPAYMFQAGVEDPILEAFIISDIMERRKLVDPAFVTDYDNISMKCQKLAVDLLSLCRTCDETTALLSYDAGIEATHAFHVASFPRLMVALHYQQKEFIAHANCQQVLQNLWYTGLPEWVCQTSLHQLRAVSYSLLLGFCMPLIFILYMFRVPYIDRFVRPAVSKFIFDVASYLVFLGVIFLNSALDRDHTRGAPPTDLEVIVLIYVFGFTWRFVRQTLRRRGQFCGNYNVYNTTWQSYELFMLLLFWCYFLLKIGLWVEMEVTHNLVPTADRRRWLWYDPFLWCEAVYACACTLAVAQVYSFFKASSILGPLQISMKSMIYDVGPFLLLFFIVMAAFAIGLQSLYRGYPDMIRVDPNSMLSTSQPIAFISLGNSFKTLFWNLFGYGSDESAEVVVGNVNLTDQTGNGTVLAIGPIVSHRLTEAVGYTLFGIYHITVIIVLLNMVIAMMANSYNRIQGNAVTEWRYARTRLILAYLNELGVLAPPFNILPFRWILGKITRRCKKCTCCQSNTSRPQSHIPYVELIERLSKRYWRKREGEVSQSKKLSSSPHLGGRRLGEKAQKERTPQRFYKNKTSEA